jgi:hypothetical protein
VTTDYLDELGKNLETEATELPEYTSKHKHVYGYVIEGAFNEAQLVTKDTGTAEPAVNAVDTKALVQSFYNTGKCNAIPEDYQAYNDVADMTDPFWLLRADLNHDKKVDMQDAALLNIDWYK